MAATKTKARKKGRTGRNGVAPADPLLDVMTLAEAAAYLRVPEADVLKMVDTQGLVGRRIGAEWRFLKSSLRDWLKDPTPNPGNAAFLAIAGKFKDDPDLEEICREAYRQRGRPITEDGE